MNDVVNLMLNSGIAIVVVAYFLVRDWKYNADMIVILNEIKTMIEYIKEDREK